ncbi:uncharacterized protein [Gossypium hirsutum]|uniref:Retrotransposon gag domain-containing protein n=1 Tax=Gossypium hirsutum TaxID=3635 RepID=A0A1U8NVJ6_GOSHI|nr:uncharacterized protein LOC107952250 [Gossypium hirsutum]
MSETSVSPTTEAESQDRMVGNDALPQAMLGILERVAGPNTRSRGLESVTEPLRCNGAKLFRGVTGVALNVVEYWMEAIERIMDDLDCTPEQILKGAVSLLRNEAYQWWLTVKEGTQLNHLSWEFFKSSFQEKYVEASYIDARRREFLNLTEGDRSVAKYEAEFLRLSRYARAMVASEYERCIHFEDGLGDSLRAKIAKKAKRTERHNRDHERGKRRRDSEPLSSVPKLKKKARTDGLVRVGARVAPTGLQPCRDYGRHHQSECWRRTEACLRVQQPSRGRAQAKGGNGIGHEQRAPGRGAGQTKARQPALVYAAHR